MKPDSLCQGKGIFLSRCIDDMLEKIAHNELLDEHQIDSKAVRYVVQQYVEKPHLVEDLKYDLRLYVLVYGLNPLRIFLHSMAFARFCTEAYRKPTLKNMQNVFMHLTNYALNKEADNYEEANMNTDEGHKRSLGAVLKILAAEGADVDLLMQQIEQLIIKTVLTAQPSCNFNYRVCQPDCMDNSMAFQILGFDVLIDHKFKPLLLEVNGSPSFATDSPLDYKIKKNVIRDTLGLLNFSHQKRQQYEARQQEIKLERLRSGKTMKLSSQQTMTLKQQMISDRLLYESSRMGGYKLIFPSQNQQVQTQYQTMLAKSQELWNEFFIGKNKGIGRKESPCKELDVKSPRARQVLTLHSDEFKLKSQVNFKSEESPMKITEE